MTSTGGQPSEESRAWKTFRAIRWTLAVLVVVGGVIATQHDVCTVTTTNRTGLGVFSGLAKNETAQACSAAGPSDLIGYFAIAIMLLLPEAKSFAIGGVRFERLTAEVEKVAKDIGELRQTVNTTINFGASVMEELKAEFRRQKATLEDLRGFLPSNTRTDERLQTIDNASNNIDNLTIGTLFAAMVLMQNLIDEAKQSTAVELAQRGAAGDTADAVAGAQDAAEVVREFLSPDT